MNSVRLTSAKRLQPISKFDQSKYKLLILSTKGNDSKMLPNALREFVRIAAKPIVNKKKIAFDFLTKLFVFSIANAIENGQIRLNLDPA